MAPARSIQCIRRPPSKAPSGFASLGSTISAISDCESRTGRGRSRSRSSMGRVRFCGLAHRPSFLKIGLHETFGHLLNPRVRMGLEPAPTVHFVFEVSVFSGPVCELTDISNYDLMFIVARDREANCVRCAILRQTGAIGGVTQIASSMQLLVFRDRAFVARCSAVPSPTIAQRKARRMGPWSV